MKLDKAKEVASKVAEIERAQEQLKRFINTKEFCEIHIKGEDGTEREYSFSIDHNKDQDSIVIIRKCITEILENKIEKLCEALEAV